MLAVTEQSYRLQQGDCLELLHQVEAGTVDLVLTDPPYNLGIFMKDRDTNLAKLRENFFGAAGWDNAPVVDWERLLDTFFCELARVMRPGGSAIIFMAVLKVETVVRLAQQYGFYYKTTGIWHKRNPMPRNMNLHFVNSTECWIYFTYKAKRGTFNNGARLMHDFIESSVTPASEKHYGKHPTQKPLEIMRYFIQVLSNPGDIVLDPFMGSGSSGVAAIEKDRAFIGFELDKSYFSIAGSRIQEAADRNA